MDRAVFDEAKASLTLDETGKRCGVDLTIHGSGDTVRLDCPFDCPGDHVGKREISVSAGHRDKLMRCFHYENGQRCPFKGDIVHLVHGLLTGSRPPEKITGGDFKRARDVILGVPAATVPPPVEGNPSAQSKDDQPAKETVPQRNTPLARSDNPKVRELAGVEELFVTDFRRMRPKVGQYWRTRQHYLTDDLCQRWGVGVRVAGAKGTDKRAWTLRNHVCYAFKSEADETLAIVGRDPEYESKLAAFEALPDNKRRKTRPPMKHKFPAGKLFARGLELYGQQRSRLEDHPEYRELIADYGIIVVEGFNDVLRLDAAEIPAVGICSNQITDAQVSKVIRFAKALAVGRVSLWFDCDAAGDEGAMRAVWRLKTACPELDVRTAWSQNMYGGRFKGQQPETLSESDLREVLLPGLRRSAP